MKLKKEIKNQKSEIFANSLTSEDINSYIMRFKLLKYEEILSKYKEIKGVSNEVVEYIYKLIQQDKKQ